MPTVVKGRLVVVVAVVVVALAAVAAVAATQLSGGATSAAAPAAVQPRLTKAAYVGAVTTIFRGVNGVLDRERAKGRISAMRRMHVSLARAAKRLRALHAPAAASKQHARLVRAMHDYAIQVDFLRASYQSGQAGAIATYLHLLTGPDRANAALRRLRAAGYEIHAVVGRPY
jgi:hypothetical protein